jgi:putative phosphoesterase
MRVAALYDIHGNLPALEAVLYDIAQADVDLLVVGGDVVSGPMPRETLSCLLDLTLPVHFVQGNADREVLAQMTGTTAGAVPDHVHELTQWVARQLPREHALVIAQWPPSVRLDIDGIGPVLFCHATPRSDMELFTRLTPQARLVPMVAGLDVSLVVCGHTHMQFDRTIGTVGVLNAGSVGMAYGEPGAYWFLLGPSVAFRRTDYDRAQAAVRIRATDYPEAEDFAANNVLHVPSETEALAVFTQMERATNGAR